MPPNSALLTDTSTSPLRAQRGAAKRGRKDFAIGATTVVMT